MRHDLRGGFGIARDRIPFEVDSGRDYQPVVRNATAPREPHLLLVAIDRRSHDRDDVNATFAYVIVIVPQRFQIAETADIKIREEASREIRSEEHTSELQSLRHLV